MTEEALRVWQQLARATQFLLNHPDTPEAMCKAIADFVDPILPDERAGDHYSRRLLAMGESLLNQKPN